MIVLLLTAILVIGLVGYIVKVLTSSSGSELKGNSLDHFILCKSQDLDDNPTSTSKYRYYDRFCDSPGFQLRILFGTEYGAAEDTAKLLYRKLLSSCGESQCKHHPRVISCRDYSQLDWRSEQLILFIISTSGDGVPPTDAREFMRYIADSDTPLNQLRYSVLALGDSNYPHFCKTGVQLDNRLCELGAVQLVGRHNVDMENQETIDRWIDLVLSAIRHIELDAMKDYLPQSLTTQLDDSHHRHNPFYASIRRKRVLTTSTSCDDRETVHIEFDLSGSSLTWQSGDALGIYALNSEEEVLDLLEKSKLVGSEMVSVDNLRCVDTRIRLTDALLKYFNLKEPSSALLKHIKAKEPTIKLMDGCGEVRDLMGMCSTLTVGAQDLVDHLKPLQPRFYSIASSPLVNANTANVTVAAVRYRLLDKNRTGVCSVHLFDRCSVGTRLGVFISHNPDFRLPVNDGTDILMIGPGTGIAPFMSFIAEQVYKDANGKMALYFGCRDSKKDFLYKEQLEQWHREGIIDLHCAFSRENFTQKIYVQHILKQHGRDVFELMQGGGHVYICGDASHMAHDVHGALTDICISEGQLSKVEATKYLENMVANNRYQKDVWVT